MSFPQIPQAPLGITGLANCKFLSLRNRHISNPVAERPDYHPVGTASMLPRENGAVVSPELKVGFCRSSSAVICKALYMLWLRRIQM
ncbi:hypothetical protein BDW71DRAFT_25534 [Aspergillus fruticulosus]